jgi:hypothetical protein
MNKHYIPIPVFDTLSELIELYKLIYDADNPRQQIKKYLDQCFSKTEINLPSFSIKDFEIALKFLYSYRGSEPTFSAYRRDIERLIQWSCFVKEKSILTF